jgi:hypothetical protein
VDIRKNRKITKKNFTKRWNALIGQMELFLPVTYVRDNTNIKSGQEK